MTTQLDADLDLTVWPFLAAHPESRQEALHLVSWRRGLIDDGYRRYDDQGREDLVRLGWLLYGARHALCGARLPRPRRTAQPFTMADVDELCPRCVGITVGVPS